jgi:20S proteasome alpha/beta subunit
MTLGHPIHQPLGIPAVVKSIVVVSVLRADFEPQARLYNNQVGTLPPVWSIAQAITQTFPSALFWRSIFCRPFRALMILMAVYPGRCPGLFSFAPSGQFSHHIRVHPPVLRSGTAKDGC